MPRSRAGCGGRARSVSLAARILLGLAAVVLLLPAGAPTQTPSALVIRGGTWFDPSGDLKPNGAIVIEGDRIAAVLPPGGTIPASGVETLDATGRFILPGFIDAHYHFRDWTPELFLAHGVTSIIDLGNIEEWVLAQRDGIRKGRLPGPRLFVAGTQLGREGRTDVESVAAARRQTRRLIDRGVDIIKVYDTVRPPFLAEIIRVAHQANIPVVAHLSATSAREAAALGIDAVAHASGLAAVIGASPVIVPEARQDRFSNVREGLDAVDWRRAEQLIEQLIAREVRLGPDLVSVWRPVHERRMQFELENYRLLQQPDLLYVPQDARMRALDYSKFDEAPAEEQERIRAGYANLRRFIRTFAARGGRVVAGSGTQSDIMPGLAFHQELELLVLAGWTPSQALLAGTREPAALLRRDAELGSIRAGALADVVLLDADPLADIRNSRRVSTVIQNGRVVDHGYHRAFSNPLRRPGVERSRNPVPVLRSIRPATAVEGSADVTLTLTGRDFSERSLVRFDGTPVETRLIDPARLEATVPGHLLLRIGTFAVVVWNPPPEGGVSEIRHFMVTFR